MILELVTGDITAQRVDAVVNAANSSLLGGGGAIHRWPKEDAVAQALSALEDADVDSVRLVLFDEPTRQLAEQVRGTR